MIFAQPAVGGTQTPTESRAASRVVEPVLTGRAVNAAGEPVAGAIVCVAIRAGNGESRNFEPTGSDGRFRVPLRSRGRRVAWCRVEVGPRRGERLGAYETYVVDVAEGFPAERDLGDLRCGVGRDVRMTVVDDRGRPVEGARVSSRAKYPLPVGMADADGVARFVVPLRPTSVAVSQKGYEHRTIDILPGDPSELRVELPRTAFCDVLVTAADGGPASGLVVRIDGPAGFRRLPECGKYGAHYVKDALESVSQDGARAAAWFRTDARGALRLGGFEAGVRLRVSAQDGRGAEAASTEFVTERGDPVRVELRLPTSPRSFRATVRDERGAPRAKARVRFEPLDPAACVPTVAGVETDAVGVATIENVFAAEGRLVVEIGGRPDWEGATFVVPSDGGSVEATVPEGRRIALHVVDDVGAPVPIGGAWAERGEPRPATAAAHAVPVPARRATGVVKSATGVVELVGLPDGALTLKARVGDVEYAVLHDGRSDAARIVVPAHGRAEVRFASRAREGLADVRVRFVPSEADGRAVRDVPIYGYDEALGALAVEALPAGRYRVETVRFADRDTHPSEFAPAVEVEVPARGTATVRIDG